MKRLQSVGHRSQHALEDGPLVDDAAGYRLRLQNFHRFTIVKRADVAAPGGMPHIDDALFNRDDRVFFIAIHRDIECRAADGDDGRRRVDRIRIRLVAYFLNMDLDFSNPDIEQIAPVRGVLPEHDRRTGVNLESAPVGHLQFRVTVRAGANNLFHLHQIAQIQYPGAGVAQDGNLPRQLDHFGGGFGRSGKRLSGCE